MPAAEYKFCHRIRARYGEGDQQGVIFNARYLDYGDIGITEYWRAVGFRFVGADALEFHVVHATVDYKKPIKPDEFINLWVRTEKLGTTSLTVLIEIHGEDGADDLRALIREVQVHVDLAEHKPIPLPDSVKAHFSSFDARADIVRTGER